MKFVLAAVLTGNASALAFWLLPPAWGEPITMLGSGIALVAIAEAVRIEMIAVWEKHNTAPMQVDAFGGGDFGEQFDEEPFFDLPPRVFGEER